MKTRCSRLWMGLVIFAVVAVVKSAMPAAPLLAQDSQDTPWRDPQKEQEILDDLAEIAPGAVPIFQRATEAMDAENYPAAQAGFEQVLNLAPDFPEAKKRLAAVWLAARHTDAAVRAAEAAFEDDPSPANEATLAHALLQRGTPADLVEAFRYAQEAASRAPDDPTAQSALFMAAWANESEDLMHKASSELLRLEPMNPISHYFAGISAAVSGRYERAEAALLRAGELGMPREAVEEVLDSGVRTQARLRRALKASAYAVAGWLVGLGLLTLLGLVLSRLTLVTVRRTQSSGSFTLGRGEKALRTIYRAVIAITSLYYYLSIPFLILIVVAVVVGIGYAFLLLGQVSIRLGLFVLIAAAFTLYSIVRSLFVRRHEGDPGRPLPREEAPALWSLAEGVAANLDTQPIDAIYVTPAAELAVMERGGTLKKLRGIGQRVLILGLGAVPGMDQRQLQAMLAHEYGHFSNRDTAGGNLAGPVRASLHQMAIGLAAAGQAKFYNPAWIFVNGFYRIYLRITLGASRLQEMLADRYAAAAYGSASLISGLRHMIRQDLLFRQTARTEIEAATNQGRGLRNLYGEFIPAADALTGELAEAEAEIMDSQTSPYSSHPAPRDRIEFLKQLGAGGGAHDPGEPVWNLFRNPGALQAEMTGLIGARLQPPVEQRA